MAVAGIGKRRLIVEAPPRHGKSSIISHWTPVWFLNNWPDRTVIHTTYSAEFAFDWGRKVRNTIDQYDQHLDVRISGDSASANRWNTTAGGGMIAQGIGGAITGRGAALAICVTGRTVVETDAGPVEIKNLESCAPSGKILAYDTRTKKPVWQKIKAVSHRQADGFYRITTSRGRVVEATGEHPFWTGTGYTRADVLAPGDYLLRAVPEEENDSSVRLREIGAKGHGGPILQQQMRMSAVQYQSRLLAQKMQAVRGQMHEQGKSILLTGVQGGIHFAGSVSKEDGTSGEALPVLPPAFSRQMEEVLQQGVCESPARAANARKGESGLEEWSGRQSLRGSRDKNLSKSEADGQGARRPKLLSLRRSESLGSSSLQHGREGQPNGESCDAVQYVPHASTWCRAFKTEPDSVALVEYVCEPTLVYSITVEGTKNFFANGILTHNCDDAFKDAFSANSAAYRGRVWEWWNSTFMTRVEPDAAVLLTMTRWHVDDLIGRILADPEQRDLWDVITMPAVAEAGDLLGRKPGEALWPEQWPRSALDNRKLSVGDYVWKALYQQKPPNLDGGNVYHEFVYAGPPDGNVSEDVQLIPGLPIDLTIDFNKRPGSHAEVAQFRPDTGVCAVLDELFVENGVAKHIAERFVKWMGENALDPDYTAVRVFGDPSGGSGSMTDGTSAWHTVRSVFEQAGISATFMIARRDPGVLNRVEHLNNALRDPQGDRNLVISTRCRRLIRDFQKVTWDGDAIDKRSDLELSHASDALAYYIAVIMPLRRATFYELGARTE